MGIFDLKGLRGLPGLSWYYKQKGIYGLDDEERKKYIDAQIKAGRGKPTNSTDYFNNLYRDDQFKKEFGDRDFDKFSRSQRHELLRHKILLDEYKRRYDPYEYDKDGNVITDENNRKKVNPQKGMGNELDFLTYQTMTSEGLEELLSSNYLTKPQREAIKNKHKDDEERMYKAAANENAWVGAPSYAQGAAFASVQGLGYIHEIQDNKKDLKENVRIEGIYAKDLKRQEEYLVPFINKARKNIDEQYKTDEEVQRAFFEEVKPTEDNPGNPLLYAQYRFDKNGKLVRTSDEMENFSTDDMRNYLARVNTIRQYLGPKAAFDAMDFSTREYLEEHEGFFASIDRHMNEFKINMLNYGTSMLRGWENNIAQADKTKYTVYLDNDGEVVETNKVRFNNKGQAFVKDSEGRSKTVHRAQMTKSELLQLGKDTDGTEKVWWLNNRFATDAQRFNTTDDAELERARKIGASPSSTIYKPGDESGVVWETVKMASFPLMDAATMLIPTGLGMASKALSTTSKVGKVLDVTSNVGRYAAATSSAVGIGHDYGTGVFGESLQANMAALEEQVSKKGQDEFYKNYNNNKDYKKDVDKRILETAKELNIEEDQAKSIVQEQEIQKFIKDFKDNDPEGQYAKGLQEAVSSAAYGANIASWTDATKYWLVNNFGFRSFLFKSPEKLAKGYLGKFYNSIKDESGKATLKKAWKAKKAIGKAAVSQFWGGAWTNFTDEMQSEGGRAINADRFAAYLNNEYDGEGTVQAFNAFNSYMAGAARALNKPHTWQAGLVGGLGSIANFTPNVGRIVGLLTPSGRAEWRAVTKGKGFWNNVLHNGEMWNIILNNGILNNYQAQKSAYNNAKEIVKGVNELVENEEEFKALADALTVDAALIDARNDNDASLLKYMKGIETMQLLNKMAEGKSNRGKIFDAVALKMTSVQDALEAIKNISEGNFNEENAAQYIQAYYDANPTIARSEENTQKALEQVITNAKNLIEINDKLQEANNTIDKHEEILGTEFHPYVRKTIAKRMAVDSFLRDKYNQGESPLTGKTLDVSTLDTRSIQSFGSITARKNTLNNITNKLKRVQSQIEEAEKTVKEKEEALNKYGEEIGIDKIRNINQISDAEKDKYIALSNDLENSKLSLGYYQQVHTELSNTAELLEKHKDETPRILTADEIINASPIDRAIMLNEKNAHNYSKNQLAEINKAREELTRKDPTSLQTIQDQADLATYIKSNARIYATMLNNPEAALAQVQAMRNASLKTAIANLNNRRIDVLDKQIEYWEKIPNATEDILGQEIFNQLRDADVGLLEDILDKNPDEIPTLSKYKAQIQRALEVSKTMDNIAAAINNMELKEAEVMSLHNNIDYLIRAKKAESRPEILDILQTIADKEQSPNVKEEDRAKFEKLLKELNSIEQLDSSTKVITKEQVEANKDKTIKEQAEQIRRVREAEEQAKREVREEEVKKATEEYNKAEELRRAKQQANNFTSPYSTGQYKTTVTRAKDGTIVTKFDNFKSTSHGGKRKTNKGVPINPSTIVDNDSISNAELLILNNKNNKYTGTVRVKNGDSWENKEVEFNTNPIETPFTKTKSTNTTRPIPTVENNTGFVLKPDEEQKTQEQPAQQPTEEQPTAAVEQNSTTESSSQSTTESSVENTVENNNENAETTERTEENTENNNVEPEASSEQAQTEHFNLKEEDNNSPESNLSAEDINRGLSNAQEVIIESPTLEEQASAVPENQAVVTTITIDQQEQRTEEQLDEIPSVTSDEVTSLNANKYPGFDINALANEKKESLPKSKGPGDRMDNVNSWLRDAGIKYQEIIDHELNKILKIDPETKIHFVRVNPQKNSTNDYRMVHDTLLAVKYTDAVSRVHKKDRGGVINIGNEQYLIVGTLGSDVNNKAQSKYYMDLSDHYITKSWNHFKNNTSDRFWVDPDSYSEIQYISNGRLVQMLLNDSESQIRTIQQLLYNEDGSINEERNPEGFSLSELQWGIQQEGKCNLIGISDPSIVDFVRDVPSNIGSVFLFAPTANGKLMPLFIRPVMLQELKQGQLVDEIKNIITKLSSTEYDERDSAIRQLSQRIVLSENDIQILIGTVDKPNITIKVNNIPIKHFELKDSTFSVSDLIDEIFSTNPRVNVTTGVLADPTTLKMYDDASALLTDAAKLGTSNAKVLIYPMDSNGKPIKTMPLQNTNNVDPINNSDLNIANRKLTQSEALGKTVYRKGENGLWYAENMKNPVTDPVLIEQIEYNNMIRVNNMVPAYQGLNRKGKMREYYILDSSRNNPKVISRDPSNKFIQVFSAKDSLFIIDKIAQIEANKTREELAKAATLNNTSQEENTDTATTEKLPNDTTPNDTEVLSNDQLLNQQFGEFGPVTEGEELQQSNQQFEQQNPQQPLPAPIEAPNKSALELSNPDNVYTADDIIRGERKREVLTILKNAGFKGKISDVMKFLEENKMPLVGITDVDNWISMLKNCR